MSKPSYAVKYQILINKNPYQLHLLNKIWVRLIYLLIYPVDWQMWNGVRAFSAVG